jgi:hypothetical protein
MVSKTAPKHWQFFEQFEGCAAVIEASAVALAKLVRDVLPLDSARNLAAESSLKLWEKR